MKRIFTLLLFIISYCAMSYAAGDEEIPLFPEETENNDDSLREDPRKKQPTHPIAYYSLGKIYILSRGLYGEVYVTLVDDSGLEVFTDHYISTGSNVWTSQSLDMLFNSPYEITVTLGNQKWIGFIKI